MQGSLDTKVQSTSVQNLVCITLYQPDPKFGYRSLISDDCHHLQSCPSDFEFHRFGNGGQVLEISERCPCLQKITSPFPPFNPRNPWISNSNGSFAPFRFLSLCRSLLSSISMYCRRHSSHPRSSRYVVPRMMLPHRLLMKSPHGRKLCSIMDWQPQSV
jgi:hypothetical protein